MDLGIHSPITPPLLGRHQQTKGKKPKLIHAWEDYCSWKKAIESGLHFGVAVSWGGDLQ